MHTKPRRRRARPAWPMNKGCAVATVGTFSSRTRWKGRVLVQVPLMAVFLLLFMRRFDGHTLTHHARVPVKTESESEQRRSCERYLDSKIRHMPFSVARRPMAIHEQVTDPPARVGVAGAMQYGRYGIDADSSSAPHSPICARDRKCLRHGLRRRRGARAEGARGKLASVTRVSQRT